MLLYNLHVKSEMYQVLSTYNNANLLEIEIWLSALTSWPILWKIKVKDLRQNIFTFVDSFLYSLALFFLLL